MKTLVVVAAGAADRPVEEPGGRTPLEAAATPALDRVAREGRIGRLVTAPPGLRAEEGAFALALFGLDAQSYGDAGASLEAAAYGVPVQAQDQVLRLSLVSADEKGIYDPTAGGIRREEAALLLEALGAALPSDDFALHPGDGWRNLLVWRGARDVRTEATPPHEAVGKPLASVLPRGAGSEPLRALIEGSREVLAAHEVNELRAELGERPAGLAWPWGPGIAVPLPDFTTRTGREAVAVGANPTFLGAAALQGIPTRIPEGATGRPGSNLRAKARAALDALAESDMVFLHVDALAAASLAHDFVAKVETLERLDGYVVGLILRALEAGLEARLVVVGGEAVSTAEGRYLPDAVPFAVWGPGVRSHRRAAFHEVAARDAGFQVDRAHDLLDFLLHLHS